MNRALSLAFALALMTACSAPEEQNTAAPRGEAHVPQAITYSGGDINANTQITSSTADVLYTDVSGGTITLSSKTSGPGTPAVGMTIIIRDTGSASGTNKVVFAPGGTWTIDGAACTF